MEYRVYDGTLKMRAAWYILWALCAQNWLSRFLCTAMVWKGMACWWNYQCQRYPLAASRNQEGVWAVVNWQLSESSKTGGFLSFSYSFSFQFFFSNASHITTLYFRAFRRLLLSYCHPSPLYTPTLLAPHLQPHNIHTSTYLLTYSLHAAESFLRS